MKQLSFLLILFFCSNILLHGQNIGIGTVNPKARLHIVDSSVLFSAAGDIPVNAGNSPVTGDGRRMMWYSDKAAFRAGYVPSSEWDKVNTGNYSVALGYGTIANNVATTAFGFQTSATGVFSTAMGYQTTSKALGAFVVGHNNDITDNPDPNNPLPLDRIFQIGNGNFSGGKSNALTVLRNGNVGIGTVSPSQKLNIGLDGALRIEGPSMPAGSLPAVSLGGYGDFQIDAPGFGSGRFVVKENGRVGIGNSAPGFPLTFGLALGDKVSLWGNSGAHYGFGIQSNLLQIHTDMSSADIAFGYGSSGSFTEKFRMKGNGALVVNGNAGTAGQQLQSNGGSASPSWVNKPSAMFFNQSGLISLDGSNLSVAIPNVNNQSFTLPQSSTVTYQFTIPLFADNGAFGGGSDGMVSIQLLDGSSNVVSAGASRYSVGSFIASEVIVIGGGNLAAGTYTIRARLIRNGTGDGNTYSDNAGSFGGIANPAGQLIIQVFPN